MKRTIGMSKQHEQQDVAASIDVIPVSGLPSEPALNNGEEARRIAEEL